MVLTLLAAAVVIDGAPTIAVIDEEDDGCSC